MKKFTATASLDHLLLIVLGILALYGFRGTYVGWSYLVAGLVGLALGVGLAEVTFRLRVPAVLLAALVVVVFFLLGGAVALHNLGGTNVLPVPHTLSELAQGSVRGWKDLLTSQPPVDNGPLLIVPYLLGLVAGSVGSTLALRTRWAPAPVLVTLALFAGVILLGVKGLHLTAAVGGLFAVLTVVWLVIRDRRRRSWSAPQGARRSRHLVAGGLCLGVALAAVAAGPYLPGVSSDRTVLRSRVVPPFNVGQFASPLVSFRRYTAGYLKITPGNALYNTALFRVTGLPRGTRIRIAALDSYDGNVWGAGNVAGSVAQGLPDTDTGTFRKVGQVIDNPVQGRAVSGSVQILDGTPAPGTSAMNVWLPTAGNLTGISFTKPAEIPGADQFRYNLASSTGVMPQGIARGDRYTFTAVLPNDTLSGHTKLASGGLPGVQSDTFQQLATTWAAKSGTPVGQVHAIANFLKTNGHYTDGVRGSSSYPAGESLYRLKLFTSSTGQLAGDDEQFSAMMALAANAIGVPARVVVGAVPEANGVVEGKDVHAWVELQAADGTWKTLPQSAYMNNIKPQKQQQQNQHSVAATTIPPPAPVHPPATAGEPLDDSINHHGSPPQNPFHLPALVLLLLEYVLLPLAVLGGICAAIIGGKRMRRRHRRTRGTPSERLAWAWIEILDNLRDIGVARPPAGTKREQVSYFGEQGLGDAALAGLARSADRLMFARQTPTAESVTEVWIQVDDFRERLLAGRTSRQRILAALNPVTLPSSAARALKARTRHLFDRRPREELA